LTQTDFGSWPNFRRQEAGADAAIHLLPAIHPSRKSMQFFLQFITLLVFPLEVVENVSAVV